MDISIEISPEMTTWPGAPKTEFSWRRCMKNGDKSNNSNFFMSSHSGTHVDAPFHFVADGDSIEKLSLNTMIGEVFVMDLSSKNNLSEISQEDLKEFWPSKNIRRLLLKTKNSKIWADGKRGFDENFCALNESGARWLIENGIELVGIDYLSIQRFKTSPIVHELLLEAKMIIIEGLDLSRVSQGNYELICLPLKLSGLEGAPARVVLRKII